MAVYARQRAYNGLWRPVVAQAAGMLIPFGFDSLRYGHSWTQFNRPRQMLPSSFGAVDVL